MTVILLPSLQQKLATAKFRSHRKIIDRLIEKLERMGKNALKVLDIEGLYLLCEMRVMRPPYRLYVIADQRSNKYYVAEWEHKDKQERVIAHLKGKLSSAMRFGLGETFT